MARDNNNPTRTPRRYQELSGTGAVPTAFPVYEGFIHSNKDYSRTGRIKVRIPALEDYQRSEDTKGEEPTETGSKGQGKHFVDVRWMSPFFGYTDYDRAPNGDPTTYQGTVKSYGMWMQPPDKGAPVIVLFIGGNTNDGIAIGSPVGNQNHAVPGIGANYAYPDKEIAAVTERSPADQNADKKVRPEHMLNKFLDFQGLAMDGIRGQSTSSTKRETPSRVFGILSPGQHQFVMDDGILVNNGETTEDANDYTAVYADEGNPNVNSFVRLRTAKGGQILIHDTAELIYLINPKGNAWVEMNGLGKIDVYGEGDISVHSEGAINLRADKEVNIEGSHINMRATEGEVKIQSEMSHVEITAKQNLNLTADLNGNILIAGHLKEQASRIDMNGPVPERACEPTRYLHSGNRSVKDSIASRVPEHEPWAYHDYREMPAPVEAPLIRPPVPDVDAPSATSNTTNPETAPASAINTGTTQTVVLPDGSTRTITLSGTPTELEAEELANILQQQQGLNAEITEQRMERHNITESIATHLLSDMTWSPYATTTNGVPTIGYSTPIQSLGTSGTASGVRTIGESLPGLPVATGGPQKGAIQEALGSLGTRIGNFFSPVGRSIDDLLGFTGNKISASQSAINNFWSTAQGAVDNSILRINEAAARNLPAGTKFGITHGEAYGAWRTRLTHNRNRVVQAYSPSTVVPQSVFDGLVAADYYYGDSERFVTASGRSLNIKKLVQQRQWEAAAKIILEDPRNPKWALEIYTIMMYGQYNQVDLLKKQSQGLRRAAELYFTLDENQRMQFEIQYFLATGKWPVMMNNKRRGQRIRDLAERSKLITPGTNVVSYEPVTLNQFATPIQSIVTSILTNRKTIGLGTYPEGYLFAVAALLSNFDQNKQVTASGATGLYQFTETQWNAIVNTFDPTGTQYGLQIVGNTVDQRIDIDKSTIAASLITNSNNGAFFDELARSPTQDELYAAHLFGITDAKLIASANTNQNLSTIKNLSTGFIANNTAYTQDQLGNTLTVGEFKQNLRNQIAKISYQYSLTYGQ